MKLGSENTNMICSLKCDQCPSCTPGVFAPTDCLVMNAVIGAFRAQEAYWNKKRENDDQIMNDADNAFAAQEEYWKHKREIEERGLQSQADDIGKRLDSVERKIKGKSG